MKRRNFIKLGAAAAMTRILQPLRAMVAGDKLRNWAGNIDYGTDRIFSARSLEEIPRWVKAQRRLKVLGTRHCFNRIASVN